MRQTALFFLILSMTGLAVSAPVYERTDSHPPEIIDSANLPSEITVQQWGIVSATPATEISPITIPEFVHRREPLEIGQKHFLLHSGIYFTPPMRTTDTLKVDVSLSINEGQFFSWYPYATGTSDSISWKDVYLNRLAEGKETAHEIWMDSRRVGNFATSFFERPGPPGTRPGDEGTTEGEVFLYAAGETGTSIPLKARMEAGKLAVYSYPASKAIPENLARVWVAIKENPDAKPVFRTLNLSPESSSAVVNLSENELSEQDFVFSLNEALSGNGLASDLAHAQTNVLMKVLKNSNAKVLAVHILSDDWVEEAFPLEIKGNARIYKRLFVGIISASE